jgi:diguanylate cyclase (GGDEF)-like protein
MREITQMQIHAARYANPLTQLPGNVPINEHIDRLLESGTRFWVCYFDLDHFKPFNDVYGYRRGDDVIQLTGNILTSNCDPDRDFVGHIGGDDFMVLFQSETGSSAARRCWRNSAARCWISTAPTTGSAAATSAKTARARKCFTP